MKDLLSDHFEFPIEYVSTRCLHNVNQVLAPSCQTQCCPEYETRGLRLPEPCFQRYRANLDHQGLKSRFPDGKCYYAATDLPRLRGDEGRLVYHEITCRPQTASLNRPERRVNSTL